MMLSGRRIGKDLEGRGGGLTEVLSRYLRAETEDNHEKLLGVNVEKHEHLPVLI
jgi:hypothetical protein